MMLSFSRQDFYWLLLGIQAPSILDPGEKKICKVSIICQAFFWTLEHSRQTTSSFMELHSALSLPDFEWRKACSIFAIYINSTTSWHKSLHFLFSDYFYPLKLYLMELQITGPCCSPLITKVFCEHVQEKLESIKLLVVSKIIIS